MPPLKEYFKRGLDYLESREGKINERVSAAKLYIGLVLSGLRDIAFLSHGDEESYKKAIKLHERIHGGAFKGSMLKPTQYHGDECAISELLYDRFISLRVAELVKRVGEAKVEK
ncbi:MAG: hypothetical protein QXR81_08470 [Candidatus Nezhaarchaeales archaeon]